MRAILALVGGGDRDQVILQTAFAAAAPLSAHLDCLHVHVSAAEAARYNRADFASGPALKNALDRLDSSANLFSELAARNVRAYCDGAGIALRDSPAAPAAVTASFREEQSNALERMAFHARRSDLVVIGRARQLQGLAPETLEHLVLHAGRPVLAAATAAPRSLTGTVMVCWNETANAARAVAAATPLIAHAERLLCVGVAERDDGVGDGLRDLARQFAWHGVPTEVCVVAGGRRDVPGALAAAAAECGADLVVMGAYGGSRVRERLLGSTTEALLDACDRPILLMH